MTETYSKAVDFGGQLAPGQFDAEIVADPGITTILLHVNVLLDVVDVVFQSTISAGEKTALDALVAAHVPGPTNKTINTDGYIDITSTLADGAAVRINASNPVGGITIDAGNQVSIDAGAASNFTTTAGNLDVNAGGVLNLEGGGGINLGSNPDAQVINIGNSTSARTLTIGNTNTSTTLNLLGGTGGIQADTTGPISLDAAAAPSNFTLATTGDGQDLTIAITGSTDSSIVLDSAGTGADAIRFNTTGGMDADAAGTIHFATSSAVGGAITLDAAFGGGGITLSSGVQGIAINANGGLIGIGHFSGGNIDIATAAVARSLTLGNITGTTSVVLNSGSGGINIGGNSSPGEVHIANTTVAKSVFIGNTTGGSRTFFRRGTGGFLTTQPAHTVLADANAAITTGALITGILTGTPTVDRTLTLPNAVDVVTAISGIAVDDSFDFHVVNKSVTDDAEWMLAMGTGGTMEGHPNVVPPFHSVVTYKASGTGIFRLRMTNVTTSSEAYTVYRMG